MAAVNDKTAISPAELAELDERLAELRSKLIVAPPSSIVDWINFMVYGDPGAGKTWLAGTAEDSPLTSPCLFIDAEGGVTTIKHRTGVDVKSIRALRDIEVIQNDLYRSIYTDPDTGMDRLPYKTVVLDSGSELTDLDMKTIMKEAYGKNPDKVDIDVPSQREWGKARAHMRAIVRAYRDLPCNFIMTAQVATLQEEGQPTKYFPGFAGKLRTELPGFFDVVGYLYPDSQGGTITRKLQVQGTRRVVAKDRTSALGDVLENTTIPEMWNLIHTTAQVLDPTDSAE